VSEKQAEKGRTRRQYDEVVGGIDRGSGRADTVAYTAQVGCRVLLSCGRCGGKRCFSRTDKRSSDLCVRGFAACTPERSYAGKLDDST
jgi:hypothetical protein